MSQADTFKDRWFYAQQLVAHEWAQLVHLTPGTVQAIVEDFVKFDGFAPEAPRFLWEMDAALEDGYEAMAIRNERTGEKAILFRGLGCTLLTLCHELVHCWRDWDDEYHGVEDWDLTVILLETARGRV